MKPMNVYQQTYRIPTSLAIVIATALMTFPAFASEPAADTSEWQPAITGLSKEQQQIVAKAREEQAAKGYTEQEQAAIDLAILKVNEITPVTMDSISNLRYRSIEWPDSSLGCAEPGVQYLQQVIPGYFVSFSVDGKIYTVNTGGGSAVVCDRINEYMSKRRERGMAIIKLHDAARADLAGKLMVKTEEILVTGMKQETWPDSGLGCPADGQPKKPGPVDGLRINMTCKDKEYEYRAPLSGDVFVSCEKIASCHETE